MSVINFTAQIGSPASLGQYVELSPAGDTVVFTDNHRFAISISPLGSGDDGFIYEGGNFCQIGSVSGGNTAAFECVPSNARMIWAAGAFSSEIVFNTSGMKVLDQINSEGLANSVDYSANTNPLRLAQLSEVQATGPVASNKVAGQSSSGNLITYAIPESSPSAFIINAAYNWRTGVGSGTVQITYTDTGSNVVTVASLPLADIAAPNANTYPIIVYAINATNISVDWVLTGVGNADIATSIQFLN